LFSALVSRAIPNWVKSNSKSRRWTWALGILSIILLTAIWGYSNVVIRQAETTIAPSVLLWMRFGMAGLVMAPLLARSRISWRDWCVGLVTGALLGICVLAQGWAMLSISVDEAAFITALYVVFTPLGESWLERRWPSGAVWGAIGFSLVGAVLLIGRLTFNLHIGVLWAFLAAIGYSGQIIGTRRLADRVTSVQLAALQAVGAGLALTVCSVIHFISHPAIYHRIFHWSGREWLWIGYLVIVSTVLAVFLQAWGQARISATEAALAFNLEPVWTAVFAWLVLAQGMDTRQLLGAALIIGSLTLVSKRPRPRHQFDDEVRMAK
jgi:drug/metabolite transporter (DMT)-like permease